VIARDRAGILHYVFENLDAQPGVAHLFTTRHGGVSEGAYSSMNMSALGGDCPDAVARNYQRIAELGFLLESMTFSQQVHACEVRQVKVQDRGKGIARKRDYSGIDGLVTNDPSISLVTFYADCVPLYFYDPVQNAIGLSHAGWRGTLGQIGVNTVEKMTECYGSKPADIVAGIGPSICKSCFEVDRSLAQSFAEALDFAEDFIVDCELKSDKSYIDLQGINRQSLINAGLVAENIELPGICTVENTDTFYSHRAMGELRGTMAAFLRLREEN
jgi:YfiH family protein